MKTKQNKTVAAIILLAVIMATSSCQKEKVTTAIKTDNVVKAKETFGDIQATILFEVTRNLSFKTENCEVITDDTVSIPHVRTIDYGTGCVGSDGRTRKGQMIITYDAGDLKTLSGANALTTFNNFFIDDVEVIGTFNLHNNGTNGNGNYTYTTIGKWDEVLTNNEGIVSIEGEEVMEWTAGANTPDISDDEYENTGSFIGTGPNGVTLSGTILQPLLIKSCERVYVSGEYLFQVSTEPDTYRHYGDGTCDNIAVETVNGVPTTIYLQ